MLKQLIHLFFPNTTTQGCSLSNYMANQESSVNKTLHHLSNVISNSQSETFDADASYTKRRRQQQLQQQLDAYQLRQQFNKLRKNIDKNPFSPIK